MKATYLSACLLALAACKAQAPTSTPTTTLPAATVAVPRPDFALRNQNDSLSYALGVNIAQGVKAQGVDSLGTAALLKAIQHVQRGDSLLLSTEVAGQFLRGYFQNLSIAKADAAKKVGRDFLVQNKTKPGVITLPSGLQYQVVQEGTGEKPKAADRVKAHYRGTTLDGKQFDSSYDRGQPLEIGVSEVVKGWTEALQLMSVGSKWKLFIPSELAYGERGAGADIPPNSTLQFDIELVSIEKPADVPAPKPGAAPSPKPGKTPAPKPSNRK